MKNTAALIRLAPLLGSSALLGALPPQNTRQDINRLVLLPGPTLTSPAKGAPQPQPISVAIPGMVPLGPTPTFDLKPTPASVGSLRLGSRADIDRTFTAPARTPASPPKPEDLQFSDRLPATPRKPLVPRTDPPRPPASDSKTSP